MIKLDKTIKIYCNLLSEASTFGDFLTRKQFNHLTVTLNKHNSLVADNLTEFKKFENICTGKGKSSLTDIKSLIIKHIIQVLEAKKSGGSTPPTDDDETF